MDSDSFFKFSNATFGECKNDGDLLTADVEEDVYDALNNETFGDGAFDGDWEEDHEKLAKIIHPDRNYNKRYVGFEDELIGIDDHIENGSKEIVEQSLSQLGLEDDLDDEANNSFSRSNRSVSRPISSIFGSSPPPPAILDAEECGSPKTRTIWSTNSTILPSSTPFSISETGGGLNNLLKSLQNKGNHISNAPFVTQMPPTPTHFMPLMGHTTPPAPNLPVTARRLEDIERDLLTSGTHKLPPPPPQDLSQHWRSSPKVAAVRAEQLEQELLGSTAPSKSAWNTKWSEHPHPTPPLPIHGGVRTLDDVERDILHQRKGGQMVDDVERFLQGGSPHIQPHHMGTPPGVLLPPPGFANSPLATNRVPQPPIGTPPQNLQSNVMSSGSPINMGVVGGGRMSPMMVNSPQKFLQNPNFPPHPLLNPARNKVPYANSIVANNHVQMNHPLAMQANRVPNRMSQPDIRRLLYSRPIRHPLLQLNFNPAVNPQLNVNPQLMRPGLHMRQPGRTYSASESEDYDEYSGLMTQREKEWLIKIQMLQLHTDNPYVDDYYHSTYIRNKMQRELEKKSGEKGDNIQLVLPEIGKHESKTYVPVQFENSLGKLQAVSVNFPRRVLEMDNQHMLVEDDNNRLPANKELHRQRRLLYDIEKLYSVLLEVDDEEKRMAGLPEDAHGPHKDKQAKLILSLYESLSCSNLRSPDEKLSQIALIRKGRHLIFRAMKLFNLSQQVTLLASLFRFIGAIVRRDIHDSVLLQYIQLVKKIISQCSFSDLVLLGQGLRNGSPVDPSLANHVSPSRERSNYIAALHSRYGVTIVCNMFHRAEELYSDSSNLKNDLESEWKQVVFHLVNSICSVKDLSFHNSVTNDLLLHLERFSIDEDKREILNAKNIKQ